MLPEMPSTSKPEQKAMAECDARKKEQMRSCADNRRFAKESCIKPGEIKPFETAEKISNDLMHSIFITAI